MSPSCNAASQPATLVCIPIERVLQSAYCSCMCGENKCMAEKNVEGPGATSLLELIFQNMVKEHCRKLAHNTWLLLISTDTLADGVGV